MSATVWLEDPVYLFQSLFRPVPQIEAPCTNHRVKEVTFIPRGADVCFLQISHHSDQIPLGQSNHRSRNIQAIQLQSGVQLVDFEEKPAWACSNIEQAPAIDKACYTDSYLLVLLL